MSKADRWSEWVLWNTTTHQSATARIGHFLDFKYGMTAMMEPPFDETVGAFGLKTLIEEGRTEGHHGWVVFSPSRWIKDEAMLRAKPKPKTMIWEDSEDRERLQHKQALGLPLSGKITEADIEAAFRARAKSAHPDTGGDAADFRKLTEAKEFLLKQSRPFRPGFEA